MTCRKRAVVCYKNHSKHVNTLVELSAIFNGTSDVTYDGHGELMVKMFDILPKQSKILMNICIRLIVIYVKPLKPSGK